MKSSKIIKLLAALLCVVMMLSSCGNGAAAVPGDDGIDSLSGPGGTVPSLEDATKTPEVEPDEFTLSDFIVINDADKVFSIVEDAPEGVQDVFENYLVKYETSVDAMNKVKMKYELVDYETGETIKTWETENSGDNMNKRYMVGFATDEDNTAALVVAFELNFVYITEQMREENYLFGDKAYYVDALVNIYDLNGTAVVEGVKFNLFENNFEFGAIDGGSSMLTSGISKGYYMSCGNGNNYLFDENGKFVKVFGAFDRIDTLCDFEDDKYRYYLGATEDWSEYSYVQVFEKGTNKLVYQMRYGQTSDENTSVFILNDGTLLVQSMRPAYDGEKYNCYVMGEAYVLDTYLYNVASGVKTDVEENYVYVSVINKSQLAAAEDSDVTLGEKFENLAMALEIVDKKISFDMNMPYKVMFVDNSLKVQLVAENEVPFANAMLFESPYVELESGYKYVEVEMFGQELIALYNAEGEFVRYLSAENHITDYFIYNNFGIFDFELNLLREFDENETVLYEFGDSLIIERENDSDYGPKLSFYRLYSKFEEKTVEPEDNEAEGEGAEGEGEEAEPEVIVVQKIEKSNFEKAESVYTVGDDFIIVYNYELETYNLFNHDFERIFVSMNDFSFEYNYYLDAYEMTTVIKGEECMYIIK